MRLARLLAVLLCASAPAAARADEAPPAPPRPVPAPASPPAPSEPEPGALETVARGLLAASPAERAGALDRLSELLARAADRVALLRRLAGTLARVTAEAGRPAPQAAAALEPAPPGAPALPPEQTEAPAPPPQQQKAASAGPEPVVEAAAAPARLRLRAWGVSLPSSEVEPLLKAVGELGSTGGKRPDDGRRSRAGPAAQAEAWARAALQLTDAQPLGEATLPLPEATLVRSHLGAALTYRCCVTPSKGGAWAVSTATIPAGLSLEARLEGPRLDVAAVWVTVAQPMATTRQRPAEGVDPIELDRPDWSLARVRHGWDEAPDAAPAEGWGRLFVEPGLLPEAGRVLVLVLEATSLR